MKYVILFDKNQYCIKEKATGHIIDSCMTKQAAVKFRNLLNGGVGFQGFTPQFILEKNLQKLELLV